MTDKQIVLVVWALVWIILGAISLLAPERISNYFNKIASDPRSLWTDRRMRFSPKAIIMMGAGFILVGIFIVLLWV
jgi:hypothetical protein